MFQKTMFWSLAAAIILIPLWIVFGKSLLGGPGGWGAFILMIFVAPVFSLYHLILFGMVLRRNMNQHLVPSEYHLQESASKVVSIYYLLHVGFQLFLNDGGDQGSMGSIMEHLGFPRQFCDFMTDVFAFAIVVVAICFTLLICCFDAITDETLTDESDYHPIAEQDDAWRDTEQLQLVGTPEASSFSFLSGTEEPPTTSNPSLPESSSSTASSSPVVVATTPSPSTTSNILDASSTTSPSMPTTSSSSLV